MVSNFDITKILHAIVHDRYPFQPISKMMTGANLNVNIFVNIVQIINVVISLDCYYKYLLYHL